MLSSPVISYSSLAEPSFAYQKSMCLFALNAKYTGIKRKKNSMVLSTYANY